MSAGLLLMALSPAVAQAPLTLDHAIGQAFGANPSTRISSAEVAQATAAVEQAQAQRRFQLTFNSSPSISNADVYQPPPNQETFGAIQNALTIPLPIGRKPSIAVTQAQRQLDAAQAQSRSARVNLATQVVTAYYDLLRKQALLDAANGALDLARHELSDAQKRYEAGDAPQLDVFQAQTPVATDAAAASQAETEVALSREALNDLIGNPLDSPTVPAQVTGPLTPLPLTLDQARAAALASSPDVAAADSTVKADKAALQLAKLYRDPTISLQASDIRSKDLTSFSRDDTFQAQVSLPLDDGGLGQAQTQAAQSALALAEAQADAARKIVLVDISAAYLNARSSVAQIDATRTARDIAQTTYDKTVLGYENGLNPLVDVLSAQNALAVAKNAFIEALYDAADYNSSLKVALGLEAAVNDTMTRADEITNGKAAH